VTPAAILACAGVAAAAYAPADRKEEGHMFRSIAVAALASLAALALVSCDVTRPRGGYFRLDQHSITLLEGQHAKLTLGSDADVVGDYLTWTSSGPAGVWVYDGSTGQFAEQYGGGGDAQAVVVDRFGQTLIRPGTFTWQCSDSTVLSPATTLGWATERGWYVWARGNRPGHVTVNVTMTGSELPGGSLSAAAVVVE
jgi:hypothetical protein